MKVDNLPVRMERPDLRGLPVVPPPDGMRLRPWRPGDDSAWTTLWRIAEPYQPIDDGLFAREFHGDHAALTARMLFLEDAGGTIIGTTCAWYDDDGGEPALGRVHWVALHPDYQGRGLAAVLLAATLQRCADLGHIGSYLHTSTGRTTAIGLYLGAGFRPVPRSVDEAAAWRRLVDRLRSDRAELLSRLLAGTSA